MYVWFDTFKNGIFQISWLRTNFWPLSTKVVKSLGTDKNIINNNNFKRYGHELNINVYLVIEKCLEIVNNRQNI